MQLCILKMAKKRFPRFSNGLIPHCFYLGSLSEFSVYDLGFLARWMYLLSFRCWYLSRVSASLLKFEMNIVVLPSSIIIGYFPASDPVNSFAFGIFKRLCSIIIRYSRVSFFIVLSLLEKGKSLIFFQVTYNFRITEELIIEGSHCVGIFQGRPWKINYELRMDC